MLLKTYFGNSANDCNIMYEINSNGSKKILDCDKIYSGEEKFVDDDCDNSDREKSENCGQCDRFPSSHFPFL